MMRRALLTSKPPQQPCQVTLEPPVTHAQSQSGAASYIAFERRDVVRAVPTSYHPFHLRSPAHYCEMSDELNRFTCMAYPTSPVDMFAPVFCPILLVWFTFFLGGCRTGTIDCCNTINDDDEDITHSAWNTASQEALVPTIVEEQPCSHGPSEVPTSQISVSDQIPEPVQRESSLRIDCCLPNSSPNILEANRRVTIVFLYAVVLTACLRIRSLHGPGERIRPAWQKYHLRVKLSIPEPNWWVVVLFNILPSSLRASPSYARLLIAFWYDGGED